MVKPPSLLRGVVRFWAAVPGPAKWILYAAGLLLCGLAPLTRLEGLIPAKVVAGLVGWAPVIVLLTLMVSWRQIALSLAVPPAWRAGDYDRALRVIRRLRLGWPSARLIRMEGLTHGLANRPAEAERCFRQALARGRTLPRTGRAGLLGCLAETLEDQGRFQEAAEYRQASIDLGENILGSARHGLAVLLLRQGTDPLRALELTDEAMRVARGPAAARVEPSRSATRAWALAMLGRSEEAEQAIARAMRKVPGNLAGSIATTQLKIGMAFLAMEQPENALSQFRAAYEADPKGKYGARALEQIRQSGATATSPPAPEP